jgi:hypothetical protein
MARITHTRLSARILFALVSLASMPAAAATFDGSWSVSIVTRKGVCDAGGSLPIQVSNGRVESGTPQVQVSGQVGSNGGISVALATGVRRATGSGTLSETSGSGTWRAPLCSGTWTAQRI